MQQEGTKKEKISRPANDQVLTQLSSSSPLKEETTEPTPNPKQAKTERSCTASLEKGHKRRMQQFVVSGSLA